MAGNGWVFNVGQDWHASTSTLNPLLTLGVAFALRDVSLAAHVGYGTLDVEFF